MQRESRHMEPGCCALGDCHRGAATLETAQTTQVLSRTVALPSTCWQSTCNPAMHARHNTSTVDLCTSELNEPGAVCVIQNAGWLGHCLDALHAGITFSSP